MTYQFSEGLVTDGGEVTNDGTAEFLASFMASFAAHIERNLGSAAA